MFMFMFTPCARAAEEANRDDTRAARRICFTEELLGDVRKRHARLLGKEARGICTPVA
jgi:hypothetical protein